MRCLVVALLVAGCGARTDVLADDEPGGGLGAGGGLGGGGGQGGSGAQGGQGAACEAVIGGSDGYTYVSSSRSLAQSFAAEQSGVLQRVELDMQLLNGGEDLPFSVRLYAGLPPDVTELFAVTREPPFAYGWSTYAIHVPPGVALTAGQRYALRVDSQAPMSSQHTVVHCQATSCTFDGVQPNVLWLADDVTGWSPLPQGGSLILRFFLDGCAP